MPKKNSRKYPTITFQPEPDVAELLETWHREQLPRGELTRRINQSLREHYTQVTTALLEEEKARIEQKISYLRRRRP